MPDDELTERPLDHCDWPVHQPAADDAPIPGRHWYAGCEPGGDWDYELGNYTGSGPRVNPDTGICEGCGESACRVCGREDCPDHQEETVSDADGADFPPEKNPDYQAMHESDYGVGLGEIDGSEKQRVVFPEPEGWQALNPDKEWDPGDVFEDEPEEPSGADQLRELAVSLREAADAVELMADRDVEEEIPAELSANADITFYTHSREEFRAFARRIGSARKSGFSDVFWLERRFGTGESSVKLVVHAPNREAVCEKRIVGYETVEETKTYTEKTGRTIQEPKFEWDCGSIFKDTEVEVPA